MQPRHAQSSTVPTTRTMAPTPRGTESQPQKTGQSLPEKTLQKPARLVEFALKMPQAKDVSLAGSFNGWDEKHTPMRRDPSGGWKTSVSLIPGRYEYRFIADGQWLSDPNARESVSNSFGTTNSVMVV